MGPKLSCILIIDDNKEDNFFHTRVIHKCDCTNEVLTIESAKQALEYLKSKKRDSPPELIFLDINMPGMNGWEFLQDYDKLDEETKSKVIITMLTTSDNPDDIARAQKLSPSPLKAFRTKPLTPEMIHGILDEYFNDRARDSH